MKKEERFTFMCDVEERRMVEKLAERLRRSQSDAVRLLVREAVAQLDKEERRERQASRS